MSVIIEMVYSYDDGEEHKSKTGEVLIKAGQEFNIMDATINYITIPVKCNNCGALNMLIAKDVDIDVEVHEKAMGKEAYHHAKGFANCKKCDKDMEASVDLVEYPEGAITFEDSFIEEVENCTYEKDVDLSEFLEK